MAMGTKRARQKQEELFYASELAEAPGHPFYEQNEDIAVSVLLQKSSKAFKQHRRIREASGNVDRRPSIVHRLPHSKRRRTAGLDFEAMMAQTWMKRCRSRD